MRVVYLNPSGQLGGAESALLDLMASIHAAVVTQGWGWSESFITQEVDKMSVLNVMRLN